MRVSPTDLDFKKAALGLVAMAYCLTGIQASSLPSGTLSGFKNITVQDTAPEPWGWSGGESSTSYVEDNETEPGTITHQEWDLERMLAKINSTDQLLAIVGGYDLLGGEGGFHPGDIFLDLDGDVVHDLGGSGNKYNIVSNSAFNYDVVIRFTDRAPVTPGNTANQGALSGLTYDIILVDSDTRFLDAYYNSQSRSNPWIYYDDPGSNDTVIASGRTATLYSGVTTSEMNTEGAGIANWDALTASTASKSNNATPGEDFHNVLVLDLSPIFSVDVTTLKVTMGCGNDMLLGNSTVGGNQVPDGGFTLVLLGVALGALGFIRRR